MMDMRLIIIVALVEIIIRPSSCQNVPDSPCPDVVQYEQEGNRWTARIVAPDPPYYGSVMKIMAKLSLPAQLPTSYVGKIEPSEDMQQILDKIGRNQPIIYTVHFPLSYPLPSFVSIIFDERVICTGPSAIGSFITSIDLEYTFRSAPQPHSNPYNLYSTPPPVYYDVSTPPEEHHVISSTVRPVSFINPPSVDNGEICGKSKTTTSLIFSGDQIDRGEYPWLVALYFFAEKQFFCAGSLISNKIVLTAAHCMFEKNGSTLSPDDFLVKLGAYSINKWNEEYSEIKIPLSVKVQPQYKRDNLINDMAIITLSSIVSFSDYIQPVCLWSGSDDQNLIYGRKGDVVGWGQDENGRLLKEGPRKITVPIVSTEECRASHAQFHKTTSPSTLCAGTRDGRGPCRGDSGGGLYINQGGRWTIRGIVSYSIKHYELTCDLKHYVVYTDVAKYADWIGANSE